MTKVAVTLAAAVLAFAASPAFAQQAQTQRVMGTINGVAYASNVMPAGGGILCLSVSKAMMAAAAASVRPFTQMSCSACANA